MVVHLVYAIIQYFFQQTSNNIILRLKSQSAQTSTYQVKAVFEGAGFKTRNLTITDPYGRDYLVCTTLQWDFKASQNSVTLTVEAPKTDTTASTSDENATVTQDEETTTATIPPPPTPEQIQAEAEQSGWLTTWHEFTWWYPWYRLHFVLNTALPPYGTLYVDYGLSILPFGTSFQANNTVLGLILNDVAQEFVEEYLVSTVIAVIAKRIAAGLLGKTIGGIVAAIGIYTLFSLLEMGVKYATTGNNLKTWLMAFLSSALACFLDLMVDVLDTLQFLTAVGRRVVGAISHTLNSMWARGLNFFDITGVIFTFIDFALMIGYLIMYKMAVG